MLPVAFIGGAEDGVGGIQPHTALKATSGLEAAVALHFNLVDQIFRALVEMGEPIDRILT